MILIALSALAIAWLGILIVIVGVCMSAAHGDRAYRAAASAARLAAEPEPTQLRMVA
jgi:hypothetical protein